MRIFTLDEVGRDPVVARLVEQLEPNGLLLAASTGALGRVDVRVAKRGNDITGVLAALDVTPRTWLAADADDDNSMAKMLDAVRTGRESAEVVCRVQRPAVAYLEHHVAVGDIERLLVVVHTGESRTTERHAAARLLRADDQPAVAALLASLPGAEAGQAPEKVGPACGVFDADVLVSAALTRYVTPWVAEIKGAYTLPRLRRQGLALVCLRTLVAALLRQTKRLCALVSASNSAGRGLAHRAGFVERAEVFHVLARL